MKELLVSTLLIAASLTTTAQIKNPLANTAWQGTVHTSKVVDVVLRYGVDTMTMYTVADKQLLETMTYTMKGDSLIWKKISGTSPCDTQAIGIYQVIIKNEEMVLKVLKDDCPLRAGSLLPKPFRKIPYSSK
ncbi:hypothetical protein [Siphonobacter curvatus]|uniref:Uncharacterized protein n=1 Tax=Siphonobacter curvatus TaxID=2094562 RepID=A0A2S7IIK4_9BACT|nr:hypothetical protein [Siphonobacter curvatus]PQA55687.1 hypothetical protein C5O19_19970 [Siphonobacter curvatus]